MSSRFPIISRIIFLIVAPIFILAIILYSQLFESLPDYNDSVLVEGIQHNVEIRRDQYGVPEIRAKSDLDAFYAMGYVQAQDRLWQLESQRRLARGKLSELYGSETLQNDIFMRQLGLVRAANKNYESLDAYTKNVLQAFSDGVNTWQKQVTNLPIEFQIFDIKPTAWTPIDSILIGKLLALTLSDSMRHELQLFDSSFIFNSAQRESIYPFLSDKTTQIPQEVSVFSNTNQLTAHIRELYNRYAIGGKNAGSNAWVVSGKHTKSGQPILANDPHLALQIPSLWYRAHLYGKRLHVSGMTIAGLPMIIFGENQDIAWGGTNLPADTQDLVIEAIHSKNPNLYSSQNGWQEITFIHEEIEVKPEFPSLLRTRTASVKVILAETDNGPLFNYQPGNSSALALRWTALGAVDSTVAAFLSMNYAKNWSEFTNALEDLHAPTLNFVYADVKGNIGYKAAGLIPIRNNDDIGKVPTPRDLFGWKGYISANDMPTLFNPDSGIIVNANNKSINDSYPYSISNNWAEPFRAQRIKQLITDRLIDKGYVDAGFFQQIQNDTVDLGAVHFLAEVCHNLYVEEFKSSTLCQWNGDSDESSAMAALYQMFLKNLKHTILSPSLNKIYGAGSASTIDPQSYTETELLSIFKSPALWCEDLSCVGAVEQALKEAHYELVKQFGNNYENWEWGTLVPREFQHAPLSNFKFTKPLYGRQISGFGSLNTVAVGGYQYDMNQGYSQNFGAGFRQIFSFDFNKISTDYVNSTGQSGNMLSPHYDDMLTIMKRKELIYAESSKTLTITELTSKQ